MHFAMNLAQPIIIRKISKAGGTTDVDFNAKMHQIRYPLRLCPRPRWGSLQRSPVPRPSIAVFKGPISKGREGIRGDGKRRKGKVKERVKERGSETGGWIWPTQNFWRGAPYSSDDNN